jgi:hypothetical protein
LIIEAKSIAPAMFRLILPSDFINDSSHVAPEAVDFSLSFSAGFVHHVGDLTQLENMTRKAVSEDLGNLAARKIAD